MMNKTPFLYKIARSLLGWLFKLYYNPKIIGSENIPKDGSALIVGNHVHLYDQCHVIISTKRCIHYMAKKEYFDSKKTAWFFKSVGCIAVDRSKKDEHATALALDVLKNNELLGLFPEGTRNGLKDERLLDLYNKYYQDITDYKSFKKYMKKSKPKTSQINLLEKLYDEKKISLEEIQEYIYNTELSLEKLYKKKIINKKEYSDSILLPFKFGAVSMASKTDSYLVPFGISGDYKFRSKNLCVKIGKPFKVGKMDLEKANDLLFKKIKELINE